MDKLTSLWHTLYPTAFTSTNKLIIHESEQYWVKNIDYHAQQDHDARLPPLEAVYIVNERADRQTLHLLNDHPDKVCEYVLTNCNFFASPFIPE